MKKTAKIKIREVKIFFTAVKRISFKMFLYQLKRIARNKFTRFFPSIYLKYIKYSEKKIRKIDEVSHQDELMRYVVNFYVKEDHGYLDRAASGEFSFFGVSKDFGNPQSIDWHHKIPEEINFHLWRQKLNHLGFVGAMLAEGQNYLSAVESILDSYQAHEHFNNSECFSSMWFTYSASHRVLAILSGLAIGNSKSIIGKNLFDKIQNRLRFDITFILKNIEHELKNNHVERNLAALCLYFSCTSILSKKLSLRINRMVYSYLTENILYDGVMVERSAMYQGLTVLSLKIFKSTAFLDSTTRSLAEILYLKASRAWAILCHPDEEISLFNDSWHDEIPRRSVLEPLPKLAPLEVLLESGFSRIQNDNFFIIFDSGAIGPKWNPGHGHSDFLSVELDIFGERLIVDPGTTQYSCDAKRDNQRSSNQHNGPSIKNEIITEYLDCFKVGNHPEAFLTSIHTGKENTSLLGRLDTTKGAMCRKIFVEDNAVSFTDHWDQVKGEGLVRLLIDSSWIIRFEEFSKKILLSKDGLYAEIYVTVGVINTPGRDKWSSKYLKTQDAWCIDLSPNRNCDGSQSLRWNVFVN